VLPSLFCLVQLRRSNCPLSVNLHKHKLVTVFFGPRCPEHQNADTQPNNCPEHQHELISTKTKMQRGHKKILQRGHKNFFAKGTKKFSKGHEKILPREKIQQRKPTNKQHNAPYVSVFPAVPLGFMEIGLLLPNKKCVVGSHWTNFHIVNFV